MISSTTDGGTVATAGQPSGGVVEWEEDRRRRVEVRNGSD